MTRKTTWRKRCRNGDCPGVTSCKARPRSAPAALRHARAARRRPPPSAVTPALIEAAKKEGKVVWYTSVDLPVAEKRRQGVRGEVSRHRGAGRALRRRARVPAHRPGIREQHPRRRRGQHRRTPRTSSSGSATAGSRPTCRRTSRKHYPGRAQGSRRHVRELRASALCVDRLQHQAGEARGRAEELRRPARSEMGRQDRQGASRLQRHHHDRDLPDRARPRLGVFREARQAEASCRCSRRPIRRRSSRSASAPSWPTATSTIVLQLKERGKPVEVVYADRRHAADHRPERRSSRTRRTRTPRGCSRAICFTPKCQQLIIDVGGLRSVHRAGEGEARAASRSTRSS